MCILHIRSNTTNLEVIALIRAVNELPFKLVKSGKTLNIQLDNNLSYKKVKFIATPYTNYND